MSTQWDKRNPEKARRRKREWAAANRERMSAANQRYYATHQEERRQYIAGWQAANPHLVRRYGAAALARRRGASIVEVLDLDAIWERDEGTCQVCMKPVNRVDGQAPNSLSFDHRVSIERGGQHTTHNVQVTHLGCNSRKGVTG